jgi:hypothetical protein
MIDPYWEVAKHKAHPDAIGVVRIGATKQMALGPDQIEEYAENAYKLCADRINEAMPWAEYRAQHLWRDLVTTWERHPDAKPANLMEECVVLVFQLARRVDEIKLGQSMTVEDAVESVETGEQSSIDPVSAGIVESPKKKGGKHR